MKTILTALMAVSMLLVGCRLTPPAAAPEPEPALVETREAEKRAEELRERVARFEYDASRIPGRGQQEYRQLVHKALTDLARILPLLQGPNPTGANRQQVAIIAAAARQLQSASPEANIEPTVTTALRTSAGALADVKAKYFSEDQGIAQSLEALRTLVDQLDATRGPMHTFVAGRVLRAAAEVIRGMSRALDRRLAEQKPPAATTTPAAQEAAGQQ